MKQLRIRLAKFLLPLGYGVYQRGELRAFIEGHGTWGYLAKIRLEEIEK